MKIKMFFNPICGENMYVVNNEKNECYIIDAGDIKMTEVINYIETENLILKGVLITHGHFDHIMGLEKVMEYKKVPIYISENDKEKLYTPELSLSFWINESFILNKDYEIITLKEGDKIFDFEILETPGHTSGSICYYNKQEQIIFTGDTLFKGTYGRVDFPTSDVYKMRETLKRLMQLPKETMIYSGHGAITFIENERKYYTHL